MRRDFENSIKWSSSYEKLVYQHGERLFIFDDGKYKIAAVQLSWELFKEKQTEVDELQKRVDAAKHYMKNIFSGDSEVDQCHLGDLLDILDGKIVDEIEQALKGGEDANQ